MRATESIRVPATVQAVLAARIDRLPVEDKRLLQMAAIIGTEVPFSLLHAIAGRPEEELRRSLGHLQAAEFLYEASLFPEVIYKFRHALTHEVVYGSLLRQRRRSLHASIAEIFERVYPDRLAEHVERLAHHTWRGEVWDKAVTYCRQAGARADDRAAFREAVTYFEQALEALGHLPETADTRGLAMEIHIDLGDALIPLGEHGRSRALLGEAEALARHLDDRSPLARVLVKMAIARRLQGDLEGAVTAGQRALDLAAELGDRGLQTAAAHRLGQAYYGRGDFGQAAELLRQAVMAVEPDMPSLMAYYGIVSRSWLALTLSALGTFAAGRCHGEEALRLALLGSQGDAPVIAHGCLGLLYVTKGDMEPAIRVLGEGLARCHATGNRDWSGTIAVALGYAYAHSGRCDTGLMLMEEAIKQSFQTEAWFAQAARVVQLSEVYLLVGRHDEAAQYARQALDLARQQQARGNEALALYQLGAVHAHADPPDGDEAEARYQDALALAEALSLRPLQAHCLRGLGTLYAKRCRWEEARLAHTAAVELYRAMDMTFWLPQAEAALEDVGRR
jgi:tetratricopeptide (TPR) repeat protein